MTGSWESHALSQLCTFQRGLTYSKSDEVGEPGHTVLRASNIDLATHQLDFSDLRYIADSVKVPESKLVRPGSLLICTASGSKSHLGKVAYIEADYGHAFGGFMGQITPLPGLQGRYLFYALTSSRFKDFIDSLSDGININNLKFDDLGQFRLPLPTLDEQRRIVDLLDNAFEAIGTATANAEANLRSAREWVDCALAEVLAQSCAGTAPRTLASLVATDCTLSYGIVQPGEDVPGGLPIVRPVDLGARVVDATGLKRIDPALARAYARTTLAGGDLLLCVRGTTGLLSTAAPELAGANVTRGIVPIRFNDAQLSQAMGAHLLRSPTVQAQIRAKTYGAALMQINIADLRQLEVQLPPREQQAALVQRLDSLLAAGDHLADTYTRKLAALAELKQSLLHQAFAGAL